MPKKNIFSEILVDINHKIQSGEYSDGQQLPTETVLAKKWNVSRPTISKVYTKLNEQGQVKQISGSGTFVTLKVKSKVLTIGLLLPGAGESEIFEIINDEISNISEKKSLVCLWEGTISADAEKRSKISIQVCSHYINQKVDGILFSPLERIENESELNMQIAKNIKAANIPMVLIDRDIYKFPAYSEFDLVSLDNFHSAYIITNHLINRGCDNLYFVSRENSAGSVILRINGFEKSLRDASIPFSKKNFIVNNLTDDSILKMINFSKDNIGIVCANDSTAAALMTILKQNKIKIPEKVKITGFDDMKYAAHLSVPLTTIRQPCRQIAQLAVELLLRRIQNPDLPVIHTHLKGELIVRKS